MSGKITIYESKLPPRLQVTQVSRTCRGRDMSSSHPLPSFSTTLADKEPRLHIRGFVDWLSIIITYTSFHVTRLYLLSQTPGPYLPVSSCGSVRAETLRNTRTCHARSDMLREREVVPARMFRENQVNTEKTRGSSKLSLTSFSETLTNMRGSN